MHEIPPPLVNNRGWPWEALSAAPSSAEDGWPRITVVTPSFNQGAFIEATLRSVLLQRYPNLEYIVLDAESTDESQAIIRRYAPCLTYWHSQRDRGQADALRTGFAMSTGNILCWLNSDDMFLPDVLRTVGTLFRRHRRMEVLYGNRLVIDRDGAIIDRHVWPWHFTTSHWALGQPLAQECCFWRRQIYERVGGIDPTWFFIMDYDLFYRMWLVGRFRKTASFLGCFRRHEDAKNARHTDVWRRELAEAKLRFGLREPGYLGSRVLERTNRLQVFLENLLSRARGVQYSRGHDRAKRRSDTLP